MKALTILPLLACLAGLAHATSRTDAVWIGATGGDWNAAENWDPAGIPAWNRNAVFTNDASPVVTGKDPFGNLRITAGTVTITRANTSACLYFRGDDVANVVTFDIAAGAKLVVSQQPVSPYANVSLRVTGGGTATFEKAEINSSMWYTFFIDGAMVEISNGGDGINVRDNLVALTNNATLRYLDNNPLANGTRVDVSRDSVFDLGGRTDYLGAFTGEGLVTNGLANLSLYGGPHVFSGRTGNLQLTLKTMASGAYAAADEEAGFVVGSSDALDGVTTLKFGFDNNGNGVDNSASGFSFLRFAPGIGTFKVASTAKGGVSWSTEHVLRLADVAGNPVRLEMGVSQIGGAHVDGPGSIVKSGDGSWHVRTDDLRNTGVLGVTGGIVYLGGETPALDADLSTISAIDAETASGRVFFRNHKPTVVEAPLLGAGSYSAVGNAADLTLNAFSLTNGTFTSNGSDVYSNVTVTGGASLNAKLYAGSMAPGCFLKIAGGTSDGMTVGPGRSFATNVVLAGGVHTNVILSAPSAVGAHCSYAVTGGTWYFKNRVSESGDHRWTMTGGFVDFMDGFVNNPGSPLSFPIAFHTFDVSGGELILRRPPEGTYPRGVGIDAHGDAKVTLALHPTSNNGGSPLRLASDGTSHGIRVADNAVVRMESEMHFNISGATASDNASTGRVEVAGGTFEMGADLAIKSGREANNYTEFILDGGTLRLFAGPKVTGDSQTALYGTYYPEFDHTWLGARTTTIDVDRRSMTQGYVWPEAFDVLPGVETDGGFVKTGYGYLQLGAPMRTVGPVVIREGRLLAASTDAAAKVFACPVTNVGSVLEFKTSAPKTTGPLFYEGVAQVRLKDASATDCVKLTFDAIRPADGASALVLYDNAAGVPFDGNRAQILLADGAADANGVVIGQNYKPAGTTWDRYEVTHLVYDAEKGFISRAYATGADAYTSTFSTDGSAWWFNDAAAATCADDAWVAGVNVARRSNDATLTIADGKTLRVGDGVHPAVVLLNGCGKQAQISGGTLDFASSKGFVLSNLAFANSYGDEINSVIAGSAGVVFGGAGFVSDQAMIKLAGANVYTGGTRVDGVWVDAANLQAFGSNPVEVRGSRTGGGTVALAKEGVFANDFTISGGGLSKSADSFVERSGALVFSEKTTLAGALAVKGEAWLRNSAYTKASTISGTISGGLLHFLGGGKTILAGDNSAWNGGLAVETGALVAVAETAALGAGEVTVDGTLRFENDAACRVACRVTGTGIIELTGAAGVTFDDLSGFTGSIRKTGDGAFDLAGDDFAIDVLVDAGDVRNSGDAATLTVGGTSDVQYDGVVSDAISLVKCGSGTQALATNQLYSGATTVAAGTLVLGLLEAPKMLPVDGAVLRLDASDAASITTVSPESDQVSAWADADGRDVVFAKRAAETAYYGTVNKAAINGLDTIHFPGYRLQRLVYESKLLHKETFAVLRPETAIPPENTWNGICIGVIGNVDNDRGDRFSTFGGALSDSGYNGNRSVTYVNGVNTVSEEPCKFGTTFVADWDTAKAETYTSWAVSSYMYAAYPRPFYGDLCEIVMYPFSLDDLQRARVTDYLMTKWGVKAPVAWRKNFDVLPATTELAVENDAVLDLWGGDQSVAALTGSGTIANSAATVATLHVTGDCTFNGTIGAGVNLVVEAGVHFVLGADAVLDENAVVSLMEGATIDLCDATRTVKQYRGYRFQVTSGAFVSKQRYVPGTYLIVR